MKSAHTPKDVDEYISLQPKEVARRLEAIRKIIKKNAKGAEEKIGYRMPMYTLNGVLIYFAAHRNHIGIYPYPNAISTFKKDIKNYKIGAGSIQFPHDEKLPLALIEKMVKFRVKEKLTQKKK